MNFLVHFLLLIVIILGKAAASASSPQIQPLLRLIDQLDSSHQNRQALELCRKADGIFPNNPEILWRKAKHSAQLIYDTSNHKEKQQLARNAVQFAEQAVAIAPQNSKARLSLAICLGKLAQFEPPHRRIRFARRIYENARIASELDPSEDYAWHVLGRWHFELAQLPAPLQKTILALYPELPQPSLQSAIFYFTHASSLAPSRVVHHIELGRALAAAGNPSQAREAILMGINLPSREKFDEESKARGKITLSKLSNL